MLPKMNIDKTNAFLLETSAALLLTQIINKNDNDLLEKYLECINISLRLIFAKN